jgi:nucleotide-binding universal stress UspA family protein
VKRAILMGKIVVGIDGSEESARALDWAVEEAQLRGLRLEVVYAYDHQPEWLRYGPPPTLEGLTLEDIERSRAQPGTPSPEEVGREHAEALLRSMLTEDVERKGVKVQRTVADGVDSSGLFRPSNTTIYLRNLLSDEAAQIQLQLGTSDSTPMAGRFD